MYKLTHSLLEQWRRATDPEADEEAYASFLAALNRQKKPRTAVMQAGIDFESHVYACARGDAPTGDDPEASAAARFGAKIRGGAAQVREEKRAEIGGVPLLLVGVADALKAGVLYDIKRVQRYEYGKYAQSTQHPMYMALFPNAARFDYLIFDGAYCYAETYRRGDFEPIESTISEFLRYLRDAGLMGIYKSKWSAAEQTKSG